VVADLVWAINSPDLIDTSEVDTGILSRIATDTIDGQHLLTFLNARPSKRVGRYFESLILYYVRHVLKYDVIASQLPVVVSGRTVGEFDFLYRDHSGVLTHLEVAVKFYLHLSCQTRHGSHFVGPNPADTFERKTQKMPCIEDQDIIDRILAHLRDKELATPSLPLLTPPSRAPPETLPLFAGKDSSSTALNQQGSH